MKTIEERADALAYEIAKSFYGFYNGDDSGSRTAMLYFENNWRHLPGLHALVGRARSLVSPILTELAADLSAEKEKEVAELREKHHEYVNLSLAKQLALQVECDKQRAALEYYAGAPWAGHAGSWSNSNIAEPANVALENKFDSSLIDEVKRVLTFYSNKVCYDHVGPEGMVGPQTACETGERARQLLTRLSYE